MQLERLHTFRRLNCMVKTSENFPCRGSYEKNFFRQPNDHVSRTLATDPLIASYWSVVGESKGGKKKLFTAKSFAFYRK